MTNFLQAAKPNGTISFKALFLAIFAALVAMQVALPGLHCFFCTLLVECL